MVLVAGVVTDMFPPQILTSAKSPSWLGSVSTTPSAATCQPSTSASASRGSRGMARWSAEVSGSYRWNLVSCGCKKLLGCCPLTGSVGRRGWESRPDWQHSGKS